MNVCIMGRHYCWLDLYFAAYICILKDPTSDLAALQFWTVVDLKNITGDFSFLSPINTTHINVTDNYEMLEFSQDDGLNAFRENLPNWFRYRTLIWNMKAKQGWKRHGV